MNKPMLDSKPAVAAWLVLLAAAGTFAVTMGTRQTMGLFLSPLNTATGIGDGMGQGFPVQAIAAFSLHRTATVPVNQPFGNQAGILNGGRQQRLFAADVEKSERFPLGVHHVNKPKVFALRCQRFQCVDHGFQLRRATMGLLGPLQHAQCRPCRPTRKPLIPYLLACWRQ